MGRGSAVYRAPELFGEPGGYNRKSDIWALGCVAYELFTKEKAFKDDFEVREYRNTSDESPRKIFQDSLGWPLGPHAAMVKNLSQMFVDQTLRWNWQARPSAEQLGEARSLIGQASA